MGGAGRGQRPHPSPLPTLHHFASLPANSSPHTPPHPTCPPCPSQVCNESSIITRNFARLAAAAGPPAASSSSGSGSSSEEGSGSSGAVGAAVDLYPQRLRPDIDRWNDRIYETGGRGRAGNRWNERVGRGACGGDVCACMLECGTNLAPGMLQLHSVNHHVCSTSCLLPTGNPPCPYKLSPRPARPQ